MSDIRFNQWLHQSGTGGVSQVASGAVGVGTTNPLADFYVRGDAQITGILTAGHIAMGSSITFGDDDRAYFGDGTDLQIYHSGSHSFIQDTGTGNLFIDSNSVQIRNAAASKTTAKFFENAQVELYYNNTERIRTTNTGAVVTGILTATGDLIIPSYIKHLGDTNTMIGFPSDDSFSVTTNNVTRMTFTGNFIDIPDAGTFRLGNSNDLQIYHGSGGASNIVHSNTSQPLIISATGAGSIRFDTNSNERLRINSSGNARIGGTSDTTDQGYRLTLQGSSNATYLQFFDNGTGTTHGSDGSFIGLINQDFYVWNREAKDVVFGSSNNEKLRIKSNGEVTIATSNPTTFRYVGTGHPYNNNNFTVHGFSNIGLVGQYSTLNMPMDHSAATTAGNWWMLGRAHGTTNEWGLSTRPGSSNALRRVWRCVTRSQNDGILDYQSFHSFTGTETLRIDSSSRALINNRGNAMPGLSANADDLVIGYGTESNETGMTMYSTSTNNIRFSDNSGTDGAIEYSHGNRWLNFSTANAYKMRITSHNGGVNPKVSVGALATSSFLNNSTDGDRSTLKVGNYLHLDSGGNGNFTAGMSYNCWPQGQQNFYQGTVTASNADNRAAAVLMRYGRTEFWNDNSTTGYTAAQQITTMQNNMTVHAAGYVTTPNQPAFKIAIMSQNSPNSGVVSENNGFTLKDGSSGDTFRDAFNNGDHFDQATGKFTAPVTGVYYFHFSVMRASTAGSGSMDLRIKKNTSLMLARSYRANYSTEGNFASINVTTITSMTAGHFIEFHLGTNMSTYEDDSYMLGYLIG